MIARLCKSCVVLLLDLAAELCKVFCFIESWGTFLMAKCVETERDDQGKVIGLCHCVRSAYEEDSRPLHVLYVHILKMRIC